LFGDPHYFGVFRRRRSLDLFSIPPPIADVDQGAQPEGRTAVEGIIFMESEKWAPH
jgi:hypothetical protein